MSAKKKVINVGLFLLAAIVIGLLALGRWRPGMAQYNEHLAPRTVAPEGAVTATWFGVTGVLLRDGEHEIFIDPFFSRPEGLLNMVTNRSIAPDEEAIRAWLKLAGVSQLDAVLVSHSHFDHGMDAGVVARLTGATLLGSASTANIGVGSGLKPAQTWTIKPGEPLQFGPFRITFIESRHAGATGGTPVGDITAPLVPPAHYLDYKLGGAYSILVEHPRGSVLHHGSAGYVPGALKGHKADVVLLGVAIIGNLDEYLSEVVDAVGAKRVMPVHWDDFTRSLDRPPLTPFPVTVRLDKFFAKMQQRPDLKVQTFELGQPVVLF